MQTKIQYQNDTDRQTIIDSNKSNILILEERLLDGNFLTFTDIKPLENQIADLQQDSLIFMDVLATMYEDMLMKGMV